MKNFKNKNHGLKSRKVVFVLLFLFVSTLIISSRADALIKIVSTFIDMLGNDIYNVGSLNATGSINTTGTVYANNLNATGDINGSKIFEGANRFPQTITCSGTDRISALSSSGTFTCSAAPNFIFSGRSSATITADAYFNPYGSIGSSTSDPTAGAYVYFGGSIKNLYAYMSALQNAGDTCIFTVRRAVGGCTAAFAATALTCSIINAVQSCSDTSNTVSVSANDCLQLYFDESVGTCSGYVSWSFEFDPT